MIYKICSRCGRRIPEGTVCPCQKIRKAQGDKQYDRQQRDKRAAGFYRSSAWLLTRQRVLDLDHHMDVWQYMVNGRVVLADTVHHIIPLRDDWSKRLDTGNLMSLNHDTHSMIEREYDRLGAKVMAARLSAMLKEYRDGSHTIPEDEI